MPWPHSNDAGRGPSGIALEADKALIFSHIAINLLIGHTTAFNAPSSRITKGNETMGTNETNETLFLLLWNQILKCPKLVAASQKAEKCGISPHWQVAAPGPVDLDPDRWVLSAKTSTGRAK